MNKPFFLSISLALLGSIMPAPAALIASDSFLVGGTGNYTSGNLSSQSATGGSLGYAVSSTWPYATGAVQVSSSSALTNPLVVNPPASNDGGMYTPGVGPSNGTRSQIRQLAAYSTSESDYYMSGLMRSSLSFTTGTSLFGLSGVTGSSSLPTVGLQVGFSGGGLISVFYRGSDGAYTRSTILSNYTANETYMFVLHLASATGMVNVNLYNSAGNLVGTLADIQTTTSVADDLTRVNASVTGEFSSGGISQVRFDEFRYGTTLGDVMVPEPSTAFLAAIGVFGFFRRRR
jgi:hypothetical protein